MECVANIVFQSFNIESRSRKLWYKRLKMVAIGVGLTMVGLFILIMSFQAVQTYHASKEEFTYSLQEVDDKFGGKYISFNPCDDSKGDRNNDIYSKMITTSYYIREYLSFNRKIMNKEIMDNKNINIDKNDNICTYYECDTDKIHRITALIEEYKQTDTKLEYAMVTIDNDNDIWSLNDDKKSNKYLDEKMVNINYCKNKQFYEWTILRKDLCLLFQCKSFLNDGNHLNLKMNVETKYDTDIIKSLVIDLSDIECHNKLFIIQWLPYFMCIHDRNNEKQFENIKEYILEDIDYYLEKVENKNIIYVIGEDDNIYKGIKDYYQSKDIQLTVIDDYNEEQLNLLMIASKAQCFIGSFFNDISNGIILNRGWGNNQCNGWYKIHGTASNIKCYGLTLFFMGLIYYGFHFFVYACFFKNRLKVSQYIIVFGIVFILFVLFLVIYNIFELSVNVLMEFKFM